MMLRSKVASTTTARTTSSIIPRIACRLNSTNAPHSPKPIKTFNKQQMEENPIPSLSFTQYKKAIPPPIRNVGMDAMVAVKKGELKHEDVRDVRDALNLHGSHAVITGATGGLGLEYACTLLPLGTHVHVIDLKPPTEDYQAVKEHVDWLKSTGRAPTAGLDYYKGDVTNAQEMYKIIGDIADKYGRLDIAIANAGTLGDYTAADEYSPQTFEKVMKVNVEGVNNTAAGAAKAMKKHNVAADIGGRIIFTASMSGSIINRDMGWSAYTTSKAGCKHLAKSYAVQLAPYGITVNSISPGHVYTAMTAGAIDNNKELENCWAGQNAMGRLGSAHELASAIAYLCMHTSTYTTGSDVIVDGGHSAW